MFKAQFCSIRKLRYKFISVLETKICDCGRSVCLKFQIPIPSKYFNPQSLEIICLKKVQVGFFLEKELRRSSIVRRQDNQKDWNKRTVGNVMRSNFSTLSVICFADFSYQVSIKFYVKYFLIWALFLAVICLVKCSLELLSLYVRQKL